jgi:hypothetical protein
MLRMTFAGVLALGALAAVGGFVPAPAPADAAPSFIPFAGTFVAAGTDALAMVPGLSPQAPWTITIAGDGHISGFLGVGSPYVSPYSGYLGGGLRDDGHMSLTAKVKFTDYDDPHNHTYTYTEKMAAQVALDGAGNVTGTTDVNGTTYAFVWTRQ